MVITNAQLGTLREEFHARYKAELEALPFKKRVREDLCAGWSDGWMQALQALKRLGAITVEG